MAAPVPDPLLSAKQVAEWLLVSEAWVRQHASGQRRVKQPEIPCVRLGSNVRFRKTDVDAYLERLAKAALKNR